MKKVILGFILIPFFLFNFLFLSCSFTKYEIIASPADVAMRAFNFAELYEDSETEYLLGGQSPVRSIQIDCSGLVIMCYKYAIVDTVFSLIESDMTANYIYENASFHCGINDLRKGDLIFMGEENSDSITHITIFEQIKDGNIYFIDSTQKDSDNDGIIDINGVSERYYNSSSPLFKDFGIMKLYKEE